jgi:hypothetical protein
LLLRRQAVEAHRYRTQPNGATDRQGADNTQVITAMVKIKASLLCYPLGPYGLLQISEGVFAFSVEKQ